MADVLEVPSPLSGEGDMPVVKKTFRGLHFNGSHSNQERIFIAVLFLRDRLRERARPDVTDHNFFCQEMVQTSELWLTNLSRRNRH